MRLPSSEHLLLQTVHALCRSLTAFTSAMPAASVSASALSPSSAVGVLDPLVDGLAAVCDQVLARSPNTVRNLLPRSLYGE